MSEAVATRMKDIRTHFQLNQKEFCQKIQLSPSRLSDIEAGNTNPSFNTLLAISEVYAISLDWLIAGKGEMFYPSQQAPTADPTQDALAPDENQLVNQYRKLTERQKGRIDQQIDIYVAENKRSSPSSTGDNDSLSNLA